MTQLPEALRPKPAAAPRTPELRRLPRGFDPCDASPMPGSSLLAWARGLLCALALTAGSARASAAPESQPTASPAPHALVVHVDPGGSGMDPDAVRAAIALELGVDVAEEPIADSMGTLNVAVRWDDVVLMSFESSDGKQSIERKVTLPVGEEQRVEAIALMAGNLARDEARDLLEAMRAAQAARLAAAQARQAELDEQRRAAAHERERAAAVGRASGIAAGQAASSAGRSPKLPPQGRESIPAQDPASNLHQTIDAEFERFAAFDERPVVGVYASVVAGIAFPEEAEKKTFNLSLSLLHARVGGVRGAAWTLLGMNDVRGNVLGVVGGFYNGTKGSSSGLQGGVLGNYSVGPLRGGEAAVAFNHRGGSVEGAQGAAFYNDASNVLGFQGSGILNLNRGELLGAQVAGIGNLARRELCGAQVAGIFNDHAGEAQGVQIAGISNRDARSLEGVEIAGIYNQARGVRGAQIGLVNVGGRVQGAQIGLVNISKKVDGVALGLVNIATEGRTQLVSWYDGSPGDERYAGLNLGVKYLYGPAYTQIGVGGDVVDASWHVSAGLGFRIPIDPLFAEVDALYRSEWAIEEGNDEAELTTDRPSPEHLDRQAIHYRAKLGLAVVPKRLGVFVGGGLRQEFSQSLVASEYQYNVVSYHPLFIAGVEVF